jgi:hypothetical protein
MAVKRRSNAAEGPRLLESEVSGTMKAVSLDQAIDVAMRLPREQREMLVNIIRRREIEARREEIAKDARASIAAFRAGKLKPQSVDKIIRELRQTSEDEA